MSEDVSMRSFVGRQINERYVLRELLGEGAFGAVYLSDQSMFGGRVRRVAIKLCKQPNLDDSQARNVFQDASRLAGAIDELRDADARLHLVHVYDAGISVELGSRAYLVMEYVHGTTLARQFKSFGCVPSNLLFSWLKQLCRAMSSLHALMPPLVHRDLKPDNVLLGVDNVVRVADFGLAERGDFAGSVAGVAGTLVYRAPETARGSSYPASDVYSIGVLLYEGLCGKLPFDLPKHLADDAREQRLEAQKLQGDFVPPSYHNNTVSKALDAIVLKCLAPAPAERYFDAKQLLGVLEDFEGKPMTGGDSTKVEQVVDPVQARTRLESALRSAKCAGVERFEALRELASLESKAGRVEEAAQRLSEAWEVSKDRAFLRSRLERKALLQEAARLWRVSGNEFQAKRYERLASHETRDR